MALDYPFLPFRRRRKRFTGNRKDCATTEDVQNQFNFAALERQNGETVAAVANNTTAVTNAVKDSEIRLQQGIGALAGMEQNIIGNTSKCCCETLRGIDGVNYNAAMNTAAINANTTAQVQKILDAITGNRMADMQNQINQLQLQSQLCGVVRYPTNTTYSVNSPCFCGNGNGNPALPARQCMLQQRLFAVRQCKRHQHQKQRALHRIRKRHNHSDSGRDCYCIPCAKRRYAAL